MVNLVMYYLWLQFFKKKTGLKTEGNVDYTKHLHVLSFVNLDKKNDSRSISEKNERTLLKLLHKS